MNHLEFVIPLKRDELLEPQPGQYHVEDVVQPRLLLSQLQGIPLTFIGSKVPFGFFLIRRCTNLQLPYFHNIVNI